MTVPGLQLPGYAAPQQLDFTPLANIGNIYQQAQNDAARKLALSQLGQGGKVDPSALIGSGDLQLAQLGIGIQNRQQDQEHQAAREKISDANEARRLAIAEAASRRAADKTPEGFTRNADGSYSFIKGGPADPEYVTSLSRAKPGNMPAGFRATPDGKLEPIPGGPADPAYLREKGDRQNAPSGYQWNDPNDPSKGMVAIPGGPAEKVDAEVAGRLGLAKSFLGQLPDIKARVEKGELAGPVNAGAAVLGAGKAGELRRKIDSGAEALLRMLTGAGMNKEEAAQYTRRYQYDPKVDSLQPKNLISKLEQLDRELNSVGEMVGKGRGGWSPNGPGTATAGQPKKDLPDPLGIR